MMDPLTGITKAVVCAILSVGWYIIKQPLLLIGKSLPYSGSNRFPLSLSDSLPYVSTHFTINKMC